MSAALDGGEDRTVAHSSSLSWPPDSGKFKLLAGVLLVLFGAYGVAYLATTLASGSGQAFGDGFGVWSWARFLDLRPASEIYDPATLHAVQVQLGMAPHDEFPFAYPPSFLLLLRPLGLLPFPVAIAAMFAVTLPLYVWATVGRAWRSAALLAALAAPTTTMAIVAGQTAFLSAALLIGGFRLLESRPIMAGMLFGVLSYKPQFGLLVPVALIAARQWRTIAAAAATVLVLAVGTELLFGAAIWTDWLAALPVYSRQFAAESSAIVHLMPTILAALLQFGLPASVAGPAQWLATLVMTAIVWAAFRRGPRELAAAALFVAGFLATPYAFVYDMPMVTTAVLWVVAERSRQGAAFTSIEMLVLLVTATAPITLPAGGYFPLVTLSLILMLGVILHRIWSLQTAGAAANQPA